MTSGEDQLSFRQALSVWDIERSDVRGDEGLGQELDALCALYEAMLDDLARWPG